MQQQQRRRQKRKQKKKESWNFVPSSPPFRWLHSPSLSLLLRLPLDILHRKPPAGCVFHHLPDGFTVQNFPPLSISIRLAGIVAAAVECQESLFYCFFLFLFHLLLQLLQQLLMLDCYSTRSRRHNDLPSAVVTENTIPLDLGEAKTW